MPHRNPLTGKFVSSDEFDDIEVVNFTGKTGIQAADLGGSTGFNGENDTFEGLELVDYDDILDRSETAKLLYASHQLRVFQNSTSSEDGVLEGTIEVSTSASKTDIARTGTGTTTVEDTVVGDSYTDDTIDIIGRVLSGVAFSPFSDISNGQGGAGGNGEDEWEGAEFPEHIGQFHPRDELYMNGSLRTWNIADAGIHATVRGQHIYGVMSD